MSVLARLSRDVPGALQSSFVQWDTSPLLPSAGIPADDAWHELPKAMLPLSTPDPASVVRIRYVLYARCWKMANQVDFRVRRYSTAAADYDKTLPDWGSINHVLVPGGIFPVVLELEDLRDDPDADDYVYRLEARVRSVEGGGTTGVLLVAGGIGELREYTAGEGLGWITVYVTATGRIERVAMARVGEEATWAPAGRAYLAGRADPRTQYVSGGELTARPASTLSIDTTTITAGSSVTISGVVSETDITVEGPTEAALSDDTSTIAVELDTAGTYDLQAEQFPELAAEWTIIVEEP